jgi:hypothetical protein
MWRDSTPMADSWEWPSYTTEAANVSACQRLWRAVIAQAWADVSGVPTVRLAPPELAAAKAFIVDTRSVWADAREFACLCAGLDADALRARFLAAAKPQTQALGASLLENVPGFPEPPSVAVFVGNERQV